MARKAQKVVPGMRRYVKIMIGARDTYYVPVARVSMIVRRLLAKASLGDCVLVQLVEMDPTDVEAGE